MNNKPHIPTEELRRQIRAMAGYGLHPAEISTVLGLSVADLAAHYRAELERGTIEAKAAVLQSLHRQATSGDTAAMKLWLEQNAGYY